MTEFRSPALAGVTAAAFYRASHSVNSGRTPPCVVCGQPQSLAETKRFKGLCWVCRRAQRYGYERRDARRGSSEERIVIKWQA